MTLSVFARTVPLLLSLAVAYQSPSSAQQTVRIAPDDRMLRGQPTRLFSIGDADGRSWEVLSNVGSVAFDRTDNLYVLDRGNHRVLVFDARGGFVRQIGRRGQGPGEFIQPVGMAITPDGMIVVMDMGQRNFSIFSRTGAFQRSVQLAISDGIPKPVLRPHPSGGVVVEVMPLLNNSAPRGHALLWYRLGGNDSPVRLLQFPPDATQEVDTRRQGGVQVNMMSRPAFAPELHWAVLPGARVGFANTAEYRVTISGSPARHLVRAIAPRSITPQDRAAERERQAAQLASMENVPPPARQALRQQLEDLRFASTIPVIRGLASDPAGRLWIARNGRTRSESAGVDIIGADGRYIGTAGRQPLPQAVSASGRIAHVATDELGVERVHVYRIPAGWGL